jgi:hypothetical protein
VSFNAPIATPDDVASAAFGARIINVKPSRIGGLRALSNVYELPDGPPMRPLAAPADVEGFR